jgi:hypothetical protein
LVNVLTYIVDYPDSVISNSAIFSCYLAYTFFHFWDTLNHIQYLNIKSLQQSEEGTFTEILQIVMQWQKRISHYISSFVIGSGNYNVDGFFESSFKDSMGSTIKIIVLFLTIPLTKNEWPWADNSVPKDDIKNNNQSVRQVNKDLQ